MTLPPGPAPHNLTVDAWALQWYPNRQGLRPSTSIRNLSLYANHIKPAFGHVNLRDITAPQVQAFITDLTTKPVAKPAKDGSKRTLAPATVREVYQELDKCLTAAKQAGLLRHNPCQDIALPRTKQRSMHLLNISEIHALAEAIDDRYAALIHMLAHSGLRIGEAAALTPSDFDGHEIEVTKTAAEVQGKLLTSTPTTTASLRSVPLPDAVAAQLAQHLTTYPGTHMFIGRDGGQIRSNVFRARQFDQARRAIGRPELRIHDLRHTAISLWIAQGLDLERVTRRAGHPSKAFTLDRYGHLYQGETHTIRLRNHRDTDNRRDKPAN